jgi:hypothetical protein
MRYRRIRLRNYRRTFRQWREMYYRGDRKRAWAAWRAAQPECPEYYDQRHSFDFKERTDLARKVYELKEQLEKLKADIQELNYQLLESIYWQRPRDS